MTIRRLLTVVFGIIGIATALGIVSLNAEMHAASFMAGESVAQAAEPEQIDPSAFLVAEIVRDGDEMLLFPQTGDVIRSHDSSIVEDDGPYLFQDGKLYTWVKGDKRRVWLFGVIAEERPSVRVAEGRTAPKASVAAF